jgi:MFS superfamily sulfate permease-like transporter
MKDDDDNCVSFVLCYGYDAAAVTYIDSSAVQALKDLYQEYKLRDIQVE